MVVDTGTGKTGQRLVLLAQLREVSPQLRLAHRLGKVIVAFEPHCLGHIRIERVDILHAATGKHRGDIVGRMRKILKVHRL